MFIAIDTLCLKHYIVIEQREGPSKTYEPTALYPHKLRNGDNAMPFQAVPNGIKVEMIFSQNGVPVVNVFHVETPDTVTSTNLSNAAATFAAWWETELRTSRHQSLIIEQIIATDISVENGGQDIVSTFTNNTGAITSAPAGANVANVISWRTLFTGRSYRGRTYLGGLANGDLVNAQNVNSAYAIDMIELGQALIDALNTAGLVLSVLSRVSNGVLRVTGILTEIVEIIVDTKVDSQRRRTAN